MAFTIFKGKRDFSIKKPNLVGSLNPDKVSQRKTTEHGTGHKPAGMGDTFGNRQGTAIKHPGYGSKDNKVAGK